MVSSISCLSLLLLRVPPPAKIASETSTASVILVFACVSVNLVCQSKAVDNQCRASPSIKARIVSRFVQRNVTVTLLLVGLDSS